MRWYIPSFHGDFRFESNGDDRESSTLTTERPTPAEIEALKRWGKLALKSNWVTKASFTLFVEAMTRLPNPPGSTTVLAIDAPLAEAAAPMAKLLGQGKVGLITALAFESGKVKMTEVVEQTDLPRWMKKIIDAAKEPPRAAATVSRPRLSCPECQGRDEGERKACDVLWDFLDDGQRKEWLKSRRFTAFGSRTGHAYDVSPRNTLRAQARGRICFDMDDHVILHNFDLTLPPEEEALQAKLVLEHREEWIRVLGEVDPSWRATPGTIFPLSLSGLPAVYR